jgi:hypothetical protein
LIYRRHRKWLTHQFVTDSATHFHTTNHRLGTAMKVELLDPSPNLSITITTTRMTQLCATLKRCNLTGDPVRKSKYSNPSSSCVLSSIPLTRLRVAREDRECCTELQIPRCLEHASYFSTRQLAWPVKTPSHSSYSSIESPQLMPPSTPSSSPATTHVPAIHGPVMPRALRARTRAYSISTTAVVVMTLRRAGLVRSKAHVVLWSTDDSQRSDPLLRTQRPAHILTNAL